MSEKRRHQLEIDPELKKEWEHKLSEFGLGEELKNPKEELPETEIFSVEHLISSDLLSRFSVLPEKLRNDILEYVRKQHLDGRSFDEICGSTKDLVIKGEELAQMDDTDSDRQYHAVNHEDDKLREEEGEIIKNVEDLLKRLEELAGSGHSEEDEETIH